MTTATPKAMLRAWHDDPVLFVRQVFKVEPNPWQADGLMAVAKHKQVAIRSGNGAGKSTDIAWIIAWFLITRTPSKVIVTAAKETQLRDVIWAEFNMWMRRTDPRFQQQFEVQADKIVFRLAPDSFAVARVARKESPEAFQGFHSPNILLIGEEASGIPEEIFEAGIGVMSSPNAKTLLCGNPTRTSGMFYDAFHKLRHRWTKLHWNCEAINRTHPQQVSNDLIDEVIARYGKESNPYRYRVLGEFPTSEEDAVIPLHLIEAATRRQVIRLDGYQPVWGLDVARFGDDRTALCKRAANVLLEPPKFWRGKDTQTVAKLMLLEHDEALEKPHEIAVDVIGVGAGVVDRMREFELPVRGINVSESPAIRERFMRQRDELWWNAREWFEAGDCSIPEPTGAQFDPMEMLIAELSQPKYTLQSGKVKVEGKDDLKKRGLASPDLADAFIMTLAGGVAKDRIQLDRYQRAALERQHATVGSWMAG